MNKIRSLEKRMDQGKKSSGWLENHLVVNKFFAFSREGVTRKGSKSQFLNFLRMDFLHTRSL